MRLIKFIAALLAEVLTVFQKRAFRRIEIAQESLHVAIGHFALPADAARHAVADIAHQTEILRIGRLANTSSSTCNSRIPYTCN